MLSISSYWNAYIRTYKYDVLRAGAREKRLDFSQNRRSGLRMLRQEPAMGLDPRRHPRKERGIQCRQGELKIGEI